MQIIKKKANKVFKTKMLLTAFVIMSSMGSKAQTPGMEGTSTAGMPSVASATNFSLSSPSALCLTANNDASCSANEWLYFKVYSKCSSTGNADWYRNPTAWMTDQDFQLKNLSLRLWKDKEIELGTSLTKEANAGKIVYQRWTDGLDIVGAGASVPERRITMFAEGGIRMQGALSVGVTAQAKSYSPPASLSDGTTLADTKLFVNGGILAKGSIICNSTWADYVFAPTYRLRPLEEVKEYVDRQGHLPNMPSAKEVEANGLNLANIARMQQEKIEELTLYLIEIKKEMVALQKKVDGQH